MTFRGFLLVLDDGCATADSTANGNAAAARPIVFRNSLRLVVLYDSFIAITFLYAFNESIY